MNDDIARLVRAAAEAAKHAPEHLQEAAFNRTFELLAQGHSSDKKPVSPRVSARDVAERAGNDRGAPDREMLDGLDRTAHPEIRHDGTALLNSLRILRAAKDELNIDGLSAASISQILVDKFRCRITRQAVSMALNRAGRYVNRHRDGGAVIFRIMAPGEEYLDASEATGGTPSEPRKVGSKKRGSRGVKPKSGPLKASESKSESGPTAKQRTGAWAATTRLLGEGFFDSPRVIGSIVEHMKEKEGRQYKANEISPALLRLLRDKKLLRAKNADGQYEYWQA